MQIKQAMILAAGLGSRMNHLTSEIPKPMINVGGKTLIEHHLEYLDSNKIYKVVINTFYKAEILERFILSLSISRKFEIYFSREDELLGTAGGIKNALKFLKGDAFFVINCDSIFIDQKPAFKLLETHWNPNQMGLIMLLSRKENIFGYWKHGDFDISDGGLLNQDREIREFVNPGMYITDYRLFNTYDDDKIELYPTILKDLMKDKKLYGVIHQGKVLHIGDLKAYEQYTKKLELV
jgi:N-acetyl-alpha-D-muramate 1-phosphate uridylyltransferase